MYRALRGIVLAVFRAPQEPPAPPGGRHARVEIFRASPKFLTYRLLAVGLAAIATVFTTAGFTLAALAGGGAEMLFPAVLVAIVGAIGCGLAYFAVHLDYDLRYYVFTERSLRVREGAWTVKEMTITYANVQNLHLHQGPLQRLFGIRDLRVDTAGGGGAAPGKGHKSGREHTITVAGVENAVELRDLILGHVKSLGADAGLGDPDDERRAPGLAAPAPEVRAALVGVAEAARRLRLACEARGA